MEIGLGIGLCAGASGLLVAFLVVVLVLGVTLQGARVAADRDELLRTGARAPARIVAVDGGSPIEYGGVAATFTLEVAPTDGAAPFTASVVHTLPIMDVPRAQPGGLVEVRYEPGRPDRVVIERIP